jgi:hypothetical protein
VKIDHLLSKQIDHEQWGVAFWAVTAQAHGTAKELALWAATLANTAFTPPRALVHHPCHHRTATLEFLAKRLKIWRVGLTPQPERPLLMGARAIAGARRWERFAAHQATTGTLTPSVTHGHVG